MPGIRLVDVRAALAALGLAALAALAVVGVTHLPVPAVSGPATHASSTGLSRLQSLPLQAQSVISSTVAADSRAFAARRTAAGWNLSGGGVRADFRAGAPVMRTAAGTLSLSLAGVTAPSSVTARGNRVTLTRPGIREWYAAGPLGIEQGFTLAHRPGGAGAHEVTLALAVGGSLHAQAAGSAVNFMGSRGEMAARYGGLTAFDATHRALPSALRVKDGRVLIAVNDRGARYPITIDPLVQQGDKLSGSDVVHERRRQRRRRERRPLRGRQHGADRGTGDTDPRARARPGCSRGRRGVEPAVERRSCPPAGEAIGRSEFGYKRRAVARTAPRPSSAAMLDDGQLGAAWVYVRSGSTCVEQKKLVGNGRDRRRRVRAQRRALVRRQHGVGRGPGRPGCQLGSYEPIGRRGGVGVHAVGNDVEAAARRSRRQSAGRTTPATSAPPSPSRPTAPSRSSVARETGRHGGRSWSTRAQRLELDLQQTSPLRTMRALAADFGNAMALSAGRQHGRHRRCGRQRTAQSAARPGCSHAPERSVESAQGGSSCPPTRRQWHRVRQHRRPLGRRQHRRSSVRRTTRTWSARRSCTRARRGVWTECTELTGAQEGGGGFFGIRVALASDGQTAMVGGPGDSTS